MTRAEYNEAVNLLADDIYRFAVHCCNDTSLGHDVVQDSFVTLWEKRDDVEMSHAKGFLLTVAYRKTIDLLRHQKSEQKTRDEMALIETSHTNPSETHDINDALYKALHQLPEQQRAILQLHDIEGYDYKEIAELMKMNYTQVQVNAFRARTTLRKLLDKWGIRK